MSSKEESTNLDLPLISESDFQIDSPIGNNIHRGIWKGIDVAVKQFDFKILSDDSGFIEEIKKICKCRHPNIISWFAICQEKNTILTEYLPNGSLFQILHDSSIELPWNPSRWNIALDIIRGLNYLHSMDIIHGDIQSSNIMLDNDWKAKISNFGILKEEINSRDERIRWRAPEICSGTKKTTYSDVYSLGMTLWEISTRKIPFSEEKDFLQISNFIINGNKEKIPKEIPNTFSQVIEKCWNFQPEERISMREIFLNFMRNFKARDAKEEEEYPIPGKFQHSKAIQLLTSGNLRESLPLFFQSAELEYPPSYLILGCYCLISTKQEIWLEKSRACFHWFASNVKESDEASLYNLGLCFHKGLGTEKNFKMAFELFKKAAEKGYILAKFSLGVCYYNGNGVEANVDKAVEFYREAADCGFVDALYNLATRYRRGEGVPKDLKKALELFAKGAAQGDIDSITNLGYCYRNGLGCEQDFDKAFALYSYAASEGCTTALYNLALCYKNGDGVKQDIQKAISLLMKAIEQKNSDAYHALLMINSTLPLDLQKTVTAFLTRIREEI